MTVAGLIAELERIPLSLRGAPVLLWQEDCTAGWYTPAAVRADDDRVVVWTEAFDG